MSPTSCQTAPPRGRNEIIAIQRTAGQSNLRRYLLCFLRFGRHACRLLSQRLRLVFPFDSSSFRLRLVHLLRARLPMPAFEFVTHDWLLSRRRLAASQQSLRVVALSYAGASIAATRRRSRGDQSASVCAARGRQTSNRASIFVTAKSSSSAKTVSTTMPAMTVLMSNTPSACRIR